MAKQPVSISDLRRKLFFEVCTSREELQSWLLTFLSLDFPDCTVDEESTSNPMQFIWECYDFMRTNEGPPEHVFAAGRGLSKTASASAIEFLALVHFRRQNVHYSALKAQSKLALKYLHKFCRIPELQGHFESKSTFEINLINLPPNSYTKKTDAFIAVVAATIEATNGYRANTVISDETDLTSRDVISEASLMGIPTADEHSFDPLTIYLSSRKTNDGPLQDRIDEAEKSPNDIRVHKVSWVDWMQKCLPETHGEPGVTAWVSRENLAIYWDEIPKSLGPVERTQLMERGVFEGCRTCPAFLVCQGRAPKQTSTSKYLKSIKFVGRELKKMTDPNKIIGQILNLKPETTGTVFNTFSRLRHVGTTVRAWEFVTGQQWDETDIVPTKQNLYYVAKNDGWKCLVGIDWGTRDSAVALTALYHPKAKRVLFLNMQTATGYANHLWAENYINTDATLFPPDLIAPDLADASSPTYFSKSGYTVRSKKPNRIETGVSQLNGLLFNPTDQSVNLMILDTTDLEYLVESFSKWRYKTDGQGRFVINSFDTDGEWTHPLDSARYLLDQYVKASVTITAGQSANRALVGPHLPTKDGSTGQLGVRMPDNFIQNHLVQNENVNPQAFDQATMYTQLKARGFDHLVGDYQPPVQEKKKARFKVY